MFWEVDCFQTAFLDIMLRFGLNRSEASIERAKPKFELFKEYLSSLDENDNDSSI